MAEAVAEEKFLQIYGQLLVQSWGDAELKNRFKSSPVEVLKEFGLDPGNAQVEVIAPKPDGGDECTPESQVKMWNDGLQSGKITFVYLDEPPEGFDTELSEEELEAVAGGGGTYCCSCSPCCCC